MRNSYWYETGRSRKQTNKQKCSTQPSFAWPWQRQEINKTPRKTSIAALFRNPTFRSNQLDQCVKKFLLAAAPELNLLSCFFLRNDAFNRQHSSYGEHSQTFDGNRTQCTFDTPRLNPNNISSQMIIQLLWLIKPTYNLWPLFISVVLTFLLWYFY